MRYKAAHPTYELAPIGAAGGSHLVCISVVTTTKLEILVHIVTSGRLHVDPKNRKTILEFPTSASKKDLRRFLGVVNYL